MSMNSGTHEQSRSIRLLTFEKNWCQAVLDKVQSISSGVLLDLPDPSQLKQLISILFHVSLETEEGIHPQISAIWLPLHKAERELGSGQAGQLTEAKRWIRFCQSIRINGDKGLLAQPSKHLRKLAALCDSEETLLLVEPSGGGDDELVAWGLLDIRYPLTTEAGSVKDLLELSTYPSALSVHFARPGYLEVKWNGKFMEGYPDNDKPKLIGTELGLFEAVYDGAGPRNIGEIVDLDHKPIKYREIEKTDGHGRFYTRMRKFSSLNPCWDNLSNVKWEVLFFSFQMNPTMTNSMMVHLTSSGIPEYGSANLRL